MNIRFLFNHGSSVEWDAEDSEAVLAEVERAMNNVIKRKALRIRLASGGIAIQSLKGLRYAFSLPEKKRENVAK